MLLKRHLINTESLRHVSIFKRPCAGSTTDKFQLQTQQKDVTFSYTNVPTIALSKDKFHTDQPGIEFGAPM